MMCPDEKLILVEIILLKILGINSNFVFRVRRGGGGAFRTSGRVFTGLSPSAVAFHHHEKIATFQRLWTVVFQRL